MVLLDFLYIINVALYVPWVRPSSMTDLWQNQRILIDGISCKINIMSMDEIVFRDRRRGFQYEHFANQIYK
jgi:hypothetical protein